MTLTRLYIPVNLDLALFDGFRKEYRAKLLKIISTIYFRRVLNRKIAQNDYVPLGREIQHGLINRRFVKRVRQDLVRLGIIEVKPVGKGKFKKQLLGYRFTDKYRGVKTINLITKEERRLIMDTKDEQLIDVSDEDLLPHERYLRACLRKVTINEEYALNELQELAEAKRKETEAEIINAYNCGLISTHAILDNNWFFVKGDKTGRIFNNITNLNSELRPFLRYEGRELVECDISNSQPLLMWNLYPDKESSEAREFKELVESGLFNERIANLCGFHFESKEQRKKFKVDLLTQVFMPEWWVGKYREQFYLKFPELAAEIKKVKNGDYCAIAVLLQTFESDLIIKTVVPLCAAKGIPLLTIHDSILTLPEHLERVKRMVIEECQRLYNLTPKIKDVKHAIAA